jgi:Fic family protein
VFETATPFETLRLMTEAVVWVRERLETRQLHPLLVTAIFIVVFLEIYPFQYGNGRLSRILTTLLLLRAGYAYVPYSSPAIAIAEKAHICVGRFRATAMRLPAVSGFKTA